MNSDVAVSVQAWCSLGAILGVWSWFFKTRVGCRLVFFGPLGLWACFYRLLACEGSQIWSNFDKFFGSQAKFKLRAIAGNPKVGTGWPAYSHTWYSPTNLPVPDLHFGDGNEGIIVVDWSGGMENSDGAFLRIAVD